MADKRYDQNEMLKLAKRRVFMKKSILWHIVLYLAVNAFLIVIYYFTMRGGYFWPLWPIVGWGLGLTAHIIIVGFMLNSSKGKDDAVTREYRRLMDDSDNDAGQ
jgi:hypothetical protein